jgi:hypothetical protein
MPSADLLTRPPSSPVRRGTTVSAVVIASIVLLAVVAVATSDGRRGDRRS